MISFEGVTVHAGDTVLLNDVSFSVNSGEKAIIGGPSGSGKSTLLLTLMGVHKPSAGRILFNGREVTPHTVHAVRKAVAFIGQEPVLGTGNVRDGLLLPFTFSANRHAKPSETEIAEMLERLKLPPEILSRDIALISGGEKQRVAIARALLAGKNVFVADEITSALDEESNRIVLELFHRPEFTVLAVSHHPRWLKQFDKSICIADGSVAEVRYREGGPL